MKYGKILLGVALLALGGILPVLAQDAADSNAAQLLTQNLYCDGRDLLEGPLGLLVGLIFVCMGVWQWIEGGKMKTIAIYIVMGGIITAIPTLINAFLGGYSSMLYNAGISKADGSGEFVGFGNCNAAAQHAATVGNFHDQKEISEGYGISPADARKRMDTAAAKAALPIATP